MISYYENKFRSGISFSSDDRVKLKNIILESTEISELESAIYIYGRSFNSDDDIANKVARYVFLEPSPGLTAVCLKVLVEYWGNHAKNLLDSITSFLKYEKYCTWYDEVIFSARFSRDNPEVIQNSEILLQKLLKEARCNSDAELDSYLGSLGLE